MGLQASDKIELELKQNSHRIRGNFLLILPFKHTITFAMIIKLLLLLSLLLLLIIIPACFNSVTRQVEGSETPREEMVIGGVTVCEARGGLVSDPPY